MPSSPIPKTRRHPDDALVSNPQAIQSTPCSPILMTRRHPDHALISNPQDTAPPRGRPAQQSPWHSDTHARRPAAIPMHSATHATRPAAIPMAQRHAGDTPSSNPHGIAPHALHARHARRPSSQPATAFHGPAPHARHARRSLPLRSQKSPLQAHIRKSMDSLRLPRFRNAPRAPAHAICRTGHEIQRFWRKCTIHCACHADPLSSAFPSASMHPKSHTCHAKHSV